MTNKQFEKQILILLRSFVTQYLCSNNLILKVEIYLKIHNNIIKIFQKIKSNYGEDYNIVESSLNIKHLLTYKKLKGGKFYYMQK